MKPVRPHTRFRRLLPAFGLAWAALSIPPAGSIAHATLQGCPDSDNGGIGKMIIGSLEDLGAVSARTRRNLLAAFEMRFERADAELKSVAKVIYCPDRRIQGAGSFDESVTSILNDEQVLLEVGARPDGSDIVVAYVVIPVRRYEFFGPPPAGMQGYHEAIYEMSRISSGLDELFRGNAELRLMAALALAVRHEKIADAVSGEADRKNMMLRAGAYYCDAVGSIESAQPRPGLLGLDQDEWDEIGAYARAGADRMVEKISREFGTASVTDAIEAVREGTAAAGRGCGEALPSADGG